MVDWPFADAPNTMVVTVRQMVNDGEPILLVVHDAEEGDWQFLTGGEFHVADGTLVTLARALNGCVEHTRIVAGFPTSQGSPGPRPACPAGERVPKRIRRNTQPPLAGGASGRQPGGGKRRVTTVLVLAGERLHLPDQPAGVVSTLRCPGPRATHPLGALAISRLVAHVTHANKSSRRRNVY